MMTTKKQITTLITILSILILAGCNNSNKSVTKSYECRFQTIKAPNGGTWPIGDYIEFEANGKKGTFIVSPSKTFELLVIEVQSGDRIKASMKGSTTSQLQISVNEKNPNQTYGFGVTNTSFGEVTINVKTPKE